MPADQNSRLSIFNYFVEQYLFAGEIPPTSSSSWRRRGNRRSDKEYMIFHSLFGRRINDALSRAFGAQLAEMLDMDIGIMVNDNGFVLIPEEPVKLKEKDLKEIVEDIRNVGLPQIIRSNIAGTELMKRKFRHVAARSFMILRNYKGHKISVKKQQFNSQLVFKAAEAINPNFPVIKETYREIMDDVMDLPRASLADRLAEEGRDKDEAHKDSGAVALLAQHDNLRPDRRRAHEGQARCICRDSTRWS